MRRSLLLIKYVIKNKKEAAKVVCGVCSDHRRPKRVLANLRLDTGRRRATADHLIGVGLGHVGVGQLVRTSADRAEQRAFRIESKAAAVDIGVEVVATRDFVALAALFVQANP
jgi:hypothetical protein